MIVSVVQPATTHRCFVQAGAVGSCGSTVAVPARRQQPLFCVLQAPSVLTSAAQPAHTSQSRPAALRPRRATLATPAALASPAALSPTVHASPGATRGNSAVVEASPERPALGVRRGPSRPPEKPRVLPESARLARRSAVATACNGAREAAAHPQLCEPEPPAPQRCLQPELDSCTRMPAPLPSAWRGKYELSPDSPTLGGGAFAEVFKVRHRETHNCFAVKVMHRPNYALRGIEKQIGAEILAMRLAAEAAEEGKSEGHIVQLLDAVEEYDYVFLLLELCEQGDLLRMLHMEPAQRFCEEVGARWARQLLLGLRTVHTLGFLHRDIKLDNLLCTDGHILKIADFGWCSTIAEAPTCLAGTFQYMAPEVLRNSPQTKAVDVWSAGVALHQMLVGKPLLMTYLGPGATQLTECDPHGATAVKQRRLLEEIAATCPPSYDRRPPDLSPMCWDFLRQMLIPEAKNRITVDAALRHPWLVKRGKSLEVEASPCSFLPVDCGHKLKDALEPEETGLMQSSKRGQKKLSSDALLSPKRGKKDALSPSSGHSSSSMDNVPTPLKPRSWDPNRNVAYTPPIESEGASNSHSTPEVSPEKKARLLMSIDRLSNYTTPASSTCRERTPLDRSRPNRTPLARLSPPAPPPRATQLCRPLGGSVTTRASPSTRGEGSPVASCDRLGASIRTPVQRLQPRIDHQAANVLLRKLNSCNEQLRQIQSDMTLPDPKRFQCSAANLLQSPLQTAAGTETDLVVSRPEDFDVLAATAPPLLGSTTPGAAVAPLRLIGGSARVGVEGLPSARGQHTSSGPENVPAANGPASAMAPSTPWKPKAYAAVAPYPSPASPPEDRTVISPSPSTQRLSPTGQLQGQRVLVTVPSPGVPYVVGQAPVWPRVAVSQVRTVGIMRRRASAPSAWMQAKVAAGASRSPTNRGLCLSRY